MKPARTIFQVLKKKILGALLLVVCLSGVTMAQSVLSDDAHTSTLPKDLDTNFGTNPNLSATSVSSVSRWCGFTRNSSTTDTEDTGGCTEKSAIETFCAKPFCGAIHRHDHAAIAWLKRSRS